MITAFKMSVTILVDILIWQSFYEHINTRTNQSVFPVSFQRAAKKKHSCLQRSHAARIHKLRLKCHWQLHTVVIYFFRHGYFQGYTLNCSHFIYQKRWLFIVYYQQITTGHKAQLRLQSEKKYTWKYTKHNDWKHSLATTSASPTWWNAETCWKGIMLQTWQRIAVIKTPIKV